MASSIFLNILVQVIIEKHFVNPRCVLLLCENSCSFEYTGNIPIVNLNIINTVPETIFRNLGCQEIIIDHSNAPNIISEFEKQIMLQTERFNNRKYVILYSEVAKYNINELFAMSQLNYVMDFLVITQGVKILNPNYESKIDITFMEHSTFKLLTHSYNADSKSNHPVLLNIWFSQNLSFMNDNNLFPDKTSNQHGKILKCATFTYPPYVIMVQGSEGDAVEEYVKRHNLKLEFVTDDGQWGIIYENWTGVGVLGNLATGKADIAIVALYSWEHEFNFLDFSKPTARTGITCLVPTPKLAAGWLTPLHPFSREMWIGTGISFVASSIVIAALTIIISKTARQSDRQQSANKQTCSYSKAFTNSVGSTIRIFLVQSVDFKEDALSRVLRYLGIIFLFSLLVSSTYSSGLASIMTIPRYENAIETALDLADSGMPWGGTQDAWTFSILAEKRPQYITLVKQFVAGTVQDLKVYSQTNNFAYAIERLPSGQYAIGEYIDKDIVQSLRLMKEDLYWEYCIVMLRKSSPLLNSLDNFLLIAAQSGLLHYWEKRAAEVHMDLRVQNIVKYYATGAKDEPEIVKLKFVHVQGAFAILILGNSLALLVFVFELSFDKYSHIFNHFFYKIMNR